MTFGEAKMLLKVEAVVKGREVERTRNELLMKRTTLLSRSRDIYPIIEVVSFPHAPPSA